jgi:manganese-dependent inorganic pyrophosphatase
MPDSAANAADRLDTAWDPDITYVVGHQRPDTDAIASALGYAWFLSNSGYDRIRPARTGQPGEQTQFALKRFGATPPPLLTGVAPTFGHVAAPSAVVLPDAPLAEAMARFAEDEQVVPVVDQDHRPKGVVTPLAVARAYATRLSGRQKGPEPTCADLAEPLPTFKERERISDHRGQILRMDETHFLVTDEQGFYVGMATQRDILQPPRAKLILVDHNELSQAVVGADEADIVGVLDHHRLGNPATAAPIPFTVDPVGSTSTLVAEKCRDRALDPPKEIAGMLLSGILSDTLVFRSPTATARDRAAAAWLAHLCRIEMKAFGEELLGASPGLGGRTVDDILDGDRKTYEMAGQNVSIAQVEVAGMAQMQELPHRRGEIERAMGDRLQREHLALFGLMITDVVTGRSRMLAKGEERLVSALPFSRITDGEFDIGDIVSRKKQLAPALYSILESAA